MTLKRRIPSPYFQLGFARIFSIDIDNGFTHMTVSWVYHLVDRINSYFRVENDVSSNF